MNKILLVLQFWKGDMAQALRLAKFIADLQDGHSQEADFLFVRRFDCPEDLPTIKYVSRKFDVRAYKSPRREVGWPLGCNGLWFGSMEYIYHKMQSGDMPKYKAILTFEADCVPLTKNWISTLSSQWDALTSGDSKVYIAGAFVEAVGVHKHINGNALLSTDDDFLKWVVKGVNLRARAGWDYFLAGKFQQWGWAALPGIFCEWRSKGFTQEKFDDLVSKGCVLHHGDKSNTLLPLARKNLL